MASMNEIDGELELLVFQYVSGELAAEDVERFESRLADDQSAREAVARVVQIGQAVVLSAEDKAIAVGKADSLVSGSNSRNVRRWVFAALSIAVAFLAGVGISQWLERAGLERAAIDPGSNMVVRGGVVRDNVPTVDDRADVTDSRSENGATTDVVALWSASAAEFLTDGDDNSAAVGISDDEETAELPLEGADFWLAADEGAADDGEFRVPSWMLAAVSPDDDPEMESPDMMSEEN
jgi:hypothetical protein